MSILVTPVTFNSSSSATKAASTPTTALPDNSNAANDTLTQADFLQIMVAQFENQDPMADSDGGGSSGTSDYVQELMSMTNITTMQTMSQQQSMQLAGTLPGSTVVLDDNGSAVSGVVSNASIENATLYITVNGTQYPASDLVSITQTQAQAATGSGSSSTSTGTGATGTSGTGTSSTASTGSGSATTTPSS
jgi:flagellar hook assembly protein FlgD